MALVKCPECTRQVSNRAIACPQCGFPTSQSSSPISTSLPAFDTSDNEGTLKHGLLILLTVIFTIARNS